MTGNALPTPCIPWPGKRDRDGYGCLTLDGERRAHRAIYKLFSGLIPDGKQVLHLCDNPPCVNPEHLVLGDMRENMRHKVAHGRSLPGVENPNSKLTLLAVQKIRAGMSCSDTCSTFGITKSTYYRVRNHESYGQSASQVTERGGDQ